MKKIALINLSFLALLMSCNTMGPDVPPQDLDYTEYYVSVGDSIEIGTSRAFECVAVIAHMSGFEEYSAQPNPSLYDSYFNQYVKDAKVKKAIETFKSLRNRTGFSYDSVADLGTYLNSDCHSYRVPKKILLKNAEGRWRNDSDSLLKVVSGFYDATNFVEFYEQKKSLYKQLADKYLNEQDLLLKIIDNYVAYYKSKPNKLRISSSYISGGGNFGTSFSDGNTTYFEPKFFPSYYGLNINLIIHELSHPNSNPVAEKIYANSAIREKIAETFDEKKSIQEQMGYGNIYTYIIELVNRANTICIMKQFCSDSDVKRCIEYDKQCRFDEIETVIEILENYKNGNYKNIMEFEPEFERFWLEKI